MFGLFGRAEASKKTYERLLGHLTDDWEMKGRYAVTFLDAYRRSISNIYAEVLKRYEGLTRSHALLAQAAGGESDALDHVVVLQACQAYKNDLVGGRHVGTDVERVIWAILCNRSDIVAQLDPSLARYLDKAQDERFPDLFEEVFRSSEMAPASDRSRELAGFLCPECGSRQPGTTAKRSVGDMPGPGQPVSTLSPNPWDAVPEIVTCGGCGAWLPAHIARATDPTSQASAALEWRLRFRGRDPNE